MKWIGWFSFAWLSFTLFSILVDDGTPAKRSVSPATYRLIGVVVTGLTLTYVAHNLFN